MFYLKYLGFTLVDEVDDDQSYGDGASGKAVQRIVAMVRMYASTDHILKRKVLIASTIVTNDHT